jgi:hypothetical protein
MSAADELAAALGDEPPAGLAQLDDHSLRHLAELITRARANQHRRLDDAIDGGLSHIPRLLRRPIRDMLFR